MANENTLSGFMITCNSCAARLKVNKPSLIGQMLACPKCGSMLKVVRPANRPASSPIDPASDQPVESATGVSDSIAPTTLKTMLTTGDFDEIEQLLISHPQLNDPAGHSDLQKFKTAPGHQPKSPTPKVNPLNRPKSSGSQTSVAAKPESDSATKHTASNINVNPSSNPLLPGDQWISHAAKKRRQMLTLLAGALSLILVLLTIVIFLLNGFGTQSSDIAKLGDQPESTNSPDSTQPKDPDAQPSPVETIENAEPKPTESPDGLSPEGKTELGEGGVSTPAPVVGDNHLSTDSSVLENADEDAPPILVNTDPPPVLPDDSSANSMNPTDSNSAGDSPDALPEIPLPSDSVPSLDLPSRSKPTLANLDRLSQMVEGSQLSIGKFKDLAATARDDQQVGLPKYFIERNDPEPVDTVAQLSIPVNQMKYEPVPLSIALTDLMSITGVPMTMDVDSIIALHGTSNPQVELQLQDVEFSQAIDSLLKSAGLIKLHPDPAGGLLIAAGNRDEFVEQAHDLPKFAVVGNESNQAAIDELSSILQGMIAPDSWRLQENPARLSFADAKMTVINSPLVQFQVRELLHKVSDLLELSADSGQTLDASKMQHLSSKLQKIQAKFERPAGLEHRISGTLVDLLNTLSTKSDVVVLADWESLRGMGFGPLTLIPGNLTGETVRDALIELTQALEITYLVVDEQTVLLTSFEAAIERTDLEVYSFKKLLKGKVTEEQALSILNQSLAEELKNPLIRSYYSPRYQALFVVAPQLLHRKIDAVIRGLESM